MNENFHYSKWRENLGENLLNYDAIVCRFDEVMQYFADDFFIRPCEDTKSFTGEVYSWKKFDSWRTEVLNINNDFTMLKKDTMVSYCSVKQIFSEYRFFVVDGKIVTASQYKRGNTVLHNANIDQYIIDYANEMINTWQPARAFVIDIASTPNGCKVIEINNFNSAGFYACDVGKIVEAIEDMKF